MLVPPKPLFPIPFDHNYVPNEEHVNAVKFMQRVCRRLRFPIRTLSTACTFFHYYYHNTISTQNDRNNTNPSDIALTAILLAAKTEETYKRIREILQAALVEANPEFEGKSVEINEETRLAVVQLEESLLEAIGYKFNHRLCLFKQLVLIGSGQLRNGRETMKKAWESMLILHCHPVVLSVPGAYLVLACILHARTSMQKDTDKECRWMEAKSMDRRIVDSIMRLFLTATTKPRPSA